MVVNKKCVICGKNYVAKRSNSRCCGNSECAKKHYRMAQIEWNRNNKKKKQTTKNNKTSIIDVERNAKKFGMSYGQYVAMLENGMRIEGKTV